MPPPIVTPPQQKTPMGPTIGIIIILLLMGVGALYFWGERLNRQNQNPPAYIPADTGNTIEIQGFASTTLP
ncbi:hypothetical protein HY968_04955 [Candidatus Kaiserbacteria bacterium]|nr:hypothetical protein [Candidatus Kaiserbacteria bacterium]